MSILMYQAQAVVPKSDALVQLHNVTTSEMNAIVSPMVGSLVFNTDDKEVYERDATHWKRMVTLGNDTHLTSGSCMKVTGAGTASNPYVATRTVPGKTKATAGTTCKTLYDTGCAVESGTYWINPDGGSTSNAFEVYCSLDGDGRRGGWTAVQYTANLPLANHGTGTDQRRWLTNNFSLALTTAQIDAIRAASTEARQRVRIDCRYATMHRDASNITAGFTTAVGFRFHHGDETVFAKQSYEPTDIIVTTDYCALDDGTANKSIFDITDMRIPVINISTLDNGESKERFGSSLTKMKFSAWFR